MRRASYRFGVEWIALNDEAGSNEPDQIIGYLSVALLADLFGIHPDKVAKDVLKYREKSLLEVTRHE